METSSHTLDAYGIAWRLGATLFFVVLNGFFVAAEFALVKVRASRIEALAMDGSRSAKVVEHILKHLDRYLSSCQLGITLASLILGALGEPAVSVVLIALAGMMGFSVAASGWVSFISIALAFGVITVLHMTVGEQAPKMWALRRAEGTSLAVAYVLRVFTWIFGPFIALINGISNWLLRIAGLPPGSHEQTHSAEEIRSIMSIAARSGQISEREFELTENVFRLINLEVRHVIVPRVDVEFLSLQRDADENLLRVRKSGHSRLPLCEEGLDSILGFIHAKDVLDQAIGSGTVDLRALCRDALIVTDTMPLSNFLLQLQVNQSHCAAVVDEHGTVIGLAFREDALEEIVGPLGDEFDESHRDLHELGAGRFEVRGGMSLPELFDRLDFELSDDEHEDEETIGGHVSARLGRLPQRGEHVEVGPYRATVLDVSRRRVQRLRMERISEDGEPVEPDEGGEMPPGESDPAV